MSNNFFWNTEFVPEIDFAGVPREEQRLAYEDWAKSPSKQNMGKIMKTFAKLIGSEIGNYQGTLDRPLLRSYARKYVADAVRSYKPESGNMLSTHIVNNLQRLHRLNYRNVQGLRASEEIQRKINSYGQAMSQLGDELGREPNTQEIADHMSVPPAFINKLRNQMKIEKSPDELTHAPQFYDGGMEDEIVDFVYFDLPDVHKKILEYKTGYNGTPIISNKEIAGKLNLSPVRVTQISDSISKKIRKQLGQS